MADSGYESFNTFAHLIRKGMYFVIRMKKINSNGILSAYDLPDSEFDTHIRTTLTRRHTKETLGNPNTYTILQPSTDFDFLDENCMYYDIEFRIVRIRLDNGTYICIATNLSEEEFPLEEINKLYRMRWSEETSFRELKYTIGLINWHSSKYDGILQEITEILPPIFNTRPLQIANPNPTPCSKSLNCTNRAKILSNSSLGMPQPVSET